MKYITLIIGLLVMGCGKTDDAPNGNERKLTAEEKKVVGTYGDEDKDDGDTWRAVYRANGIVEGYKNGEKQPQESKWKIVDGELHITSEMATVVAIINKDGGITIIATIEDGKRKDVSKEEQQQFILKKIK